MADLERRISHPNHGQLHRTMGLGELKGRRKTGETGIEQPDCRPCCLYCGAHTCSAALDNGRIIKVAAGELMACPGGDPPIKAVSDCFCAVCATCDEEFGITHRDNLSAGQVLKL